MSFRATLARSALVPLLLASLCFAQPTSATSPQGLIVASRIDVAGAGLDPLAREPMVVELPNGDLFVAGYGSSDPDSMPKLWRSTDSGKSWQKLQLGSAADGAIGNSDTDLAVAADGTLYLVNMGFEVKGEEYAGTHISVGVSKDSGKHWKWTVLTRKRKCDRPWVAVAPDGTAHVIWNDGDAVYHRISKDRGATWIEMPAINEPGGSSHLAVGPKNEVAVRVTPVSASGAKYVPGVDYIFISTDGGSTWTKNVPPGLRDWGPMDSPNLTPRWVEPIAWDTADNLYSLWTEKTGVWLGRSPDRGKTWKSWLIAPADQVCYYPYLVASGHGDLAATWTCGVKDNLRFTAHRIRFAANDTPQILSSDPLQLDIWLRDFEKEKPTDPDARGTAGEYFAIAFLCNGDLGVVTPIQSVDNKRNGFTFWRFRDQQRTSKLAQH